MKKSDLKKVLKPIIKECIKEAIFEEGMLSGIITEVASGIKNISTVSAQQYTTPPSVVTKNQLQDIGPSQSVLDAKKQLSEVKSQLSKATGFQGIFENTKPLPASRKSDQQSNKYGALRDTDPNDPGVNIDGLLKLTGGWKI